MMYRGSFAPLDINVAINALKINKTIKFAYWISSEFRLGFSNQPISVIPGNDFLKTKKAALMMSNSGSISKVL